MEIITLIWIVGVIIQNEPVSAQIPESRKFESTEACAKFGEAMTDRMQDWVRGYLKADWPYPVKVSFKCDGGQPL